MPEVFAFILRAAQDPSHPYLLVLDEMNLAHVERYFSDFLSGIESRRPVLPDLTKDERGNWTLRDPAAERLALPPNLFVVGTVNVDETTYMFSPKVLDRAFTFEFRVAADDLDESLARPRAVESGADHLLRAFCALAADEDWHLRNPHPSRQELSQALRELHGILSTADQEFGHRSFYEMLRFCAFYAATGSDDADAALDLAVMQKLLPRFTVPDGAWSPSW